MCKFLLNTAAIGAKVVQETKWAQDINIKKKDHFIPLKELCLCFISSWRPALSVHVPVPGKFSERYLGQLQVIPEPQTDHRKGCPESLTCCYKVPAQSWASAAVLTANSWSSCLVGASPRACSCPLLFSQLHSPSPVSSVSPHSSKWSQKRKVCIHWDIKKVTDPKDWEGLWKSPQSSCFRGLFSLSWG